ncbi:BT4734/BF3469 family protein [Thiospirochaeta perfilievii]|uniref:BT4734/BF3469 family protein n=1 Tax=Thiospirochaeta perfilievii TaxID=252967 RepID=UPI001659A00E|nr:BT4734/BF3469 family protein [Thiospirochaeta perfilievii]
MINELDLSKYQIPWFVGVKQSQIVNHSTIFNILDGIKTSYITETNKLRSFKPDSIEKADYKKTLNGVVFSANFYNYRRKDQLKNYYSLIVLDIDKLDKRLHEKHLNQLKSDKYVQSAWTSPSGDGIKGIVFLNYQYVYDDVVEAHKNAYNQLRSYFWNRYNIILDENCNDITRLCFVSHDPNIHIKDTFSLYRIFKEESISNPSDKKNVSKATKPFRYFEYKDMVISQNSELEELKREKYKYNRRSMQRIYKYLVKRSRSITATYHRWVFVALALSTTFPYLTARKYFIKLCRLDGHKHDEVASFKLFDDCYKKNKGEYNYSSIVYYAKEQGYYGSEKKQSTED